MAKTPRRPSRILYGVYSPHQSLCFFDEPFIRALDREVTAVQGCATIGQAMKLSTELKHTWVPGIPEDEEKELEEEGLTPDSPYDWSESGSVLDGDWPPMPTRLSLDVFAEDDKEAWALILSSNLGARVVSTTLNGDYLEIPEENEAALVAVFDQLGIPYVRDDSLVERLSLT